MTDGLFLECVRNVAKEFPEVLLDDLMIDAWPPIWCAIRRDST